MTFASPAWAFIAKSQHKSLQVVQNRALRIIGGYDIPVQIKMHFDHKIPKLKSYIKCLALKMYTTAKCSRNRYVRKLGAVFMVIDPRVPRPPPYAKIVRGCAMARSRHRHPIPERN